MGEPDVSDLISVEQAMAIIDAAPVRPIVRQLPLGEALGLYLAEDLQSDRDAPPFDKSVMDGFAVRAGDTASAPRELTVVGQIAAGESAEIPFKAGETISIMTGAPLPPGADAVVPVEQTERLRRADRILIRQPASAGQFIAKRGSDYPAGAGLLKTSVRLGPAQIAVAASIGAAPVAVYAPPSVAVVGTGDELVAPTEIPKASQIRSCNNPMLLSLLAGWPVQAFDLGLVPDDRTRIEAKIHAAMAHDVVLITGGMSMGERDYVPDILRKLGACLKITKLRIKPGKPFVFAEMPGGKFAFGLPGNPVSAFVCTRILVSRLLMRMAGGAASLPPRTAPLAKSVGTNGPRAFYQPAVFDGNSLTPLDWRGSADIFTLSRANCLLIRPENHPVQPPGAQIEYVEI
jgi:molybdopterin molybdotransferase